MDLTCSYPIANKLIDSEGRQYDSVDSLYELPNNPECNAGLQPGFTDHMTYAYRVPAGDLIVGWGFSDDTSLRYASDALTIIPIHIRAR
jgi:hypothetical protein